MDTPIIRINFTMVIIVVAIASRVSNDMSLDSLWF